MSSYYMSNGMSNESNGGPGVAGAGWGAAVRSRAARLAWAAAVATTVPRLAWATGVCGTRPALHPPA